MNCDRCDNVAVEHVAIREAGNTRELHLCERCANADAEITEPRRAAQLNRPARRPTIVQEFIRQWEMRRRSLGRDLSKQELIELLDRLCD